MTTDYFFFWIELQLLFFLCTICHKTVWHQCYSNYQRNDLDPLTFFVILIRQILLGHLQLHLAKKRMSVSVKYYINCIFCKETIFVDMLVDIISPTFLQYAAPFYRRKGGGGGGGTLIFFIMVWRRYNIRRWKRCVTCHMFILPACRAPFNPWL